MWVSDGNSSRVPIGPWSDLLSLINGFQVTQAIHVASTLRIADHLTVGARSADELAALTQSHSGALYRLLRALAAVGVFREDQGRKFTLTPMGDCLRSDDPDRGMGGSRLIFPRKSRRA